MTGHDRGVSQAFMPVALRMVRGLIRKDIESLKAYCEERVRVDR